MVKRLIISVLCILAVYGGIEAWPLLYGPSLSITSPLDNASFPGGIVPIEGRAPRAARLTLNGAPLLYEENGRFSSALTFPRGGSILRFEAQDRFGRKITETRSIFVPFEN
ncbi:MAG: hypothetical protein PHD04_00310 [Candidatus Pacebacteria bacterium]|nr:hypothetical protein [Candidatus Paceibacterota bacterium]